MGGAQDEQWQVRTKQDKEDQHRVRVVYVCPVTDPLV